MSGWETVGEVVKEGQEVYVKLLGFDDRGKVRLSMKIVDQATGKEIPRAEGEPEEVLSESRTPPQVAVPTAPGPHCVPDVLGRRMSPRPFPAHSSVTDCSTRGRAFNAA